MLYQIKLYGVIAMVAGAILVIVSLLNVPKIVAVGIILGGALGFAGYRVFER